MVSGVSANPELLSMDNLIESEKNGDPFELANFDFENDVALLPYSSGTTGLPKGVQLTHKNLVGNITQFITPKKELDFIKPATGKFWAWHFHFKKSKLSAFSYNSILESFQPSTVCVLPLFHIFGSFVTSLPTLQGKYCQAANTNIFDLHAFIVFKQSVEKSPFYPRLNPHHF